MRVDLCLIITRGDKSIGRVEKRETPLLEMRLKMIEMSWEWMRNFIKLCW
jgi:hypothetical protein